MIPAYVTIGLFLGVVGSSAFNGELYTWHLRDYGSMAECQAAKAVARPQYVEQYKTLAAPGESIRLWCIKSQES